jgi:redox-sensitive bicupin YhaK (pirin superfamily)
MAAGMAMPPRNDPLPPRRHGDPGWHAILPALRPTRQGPTAMTLLVSPRTHDLGDGFVVRRAVPSLQARSIGPFVFVDHMGPAMFEPGRGMDVRPHPHIGLATVTYLWEGAIHHRDTLGSDQVIRRATSTG